MSDWLENERGICKTTLGVVECSGYDPTIRVCLTFNLRTVPIVIAHTFCASRDTRISYR